MAEGDLQQIAIECRARVQEFQRTRKQRQAAVDQLRRLTNQLPDSAELRQQFTEALQKLSSQ